MTPADSDSHDARVARSAVAGCPDDRHAASHAHARERLDIAPRTETIAASDCTDQSGPSPLLDSTHNVPVCPYSITNAVPHERPSLLLLSIPHGPLLRPHSAHAAPMTDRTNLPRPVVHQIARGRLLSGRAGAEPVAVSTATSMKRARRESPPSSPQQNTVTFPSSEGSSAMPKPAGKRARVAIAIAQKPLSSIGEENEAAEEDACAAARARLNSISLITTTRTSSRRKSRRQRLYATQFPARSFVPRLESITEITELENMPHLACETAVMLTHHDATNPVKTAIKIFTSTSEGGAGRRRSLTLIEPLRGAWRRLRRADEEH